MSQNGGPRLPDNSKPAQHPDNNLPQAPPIPNTAHEAAQRGGARA